MKSVLKRKWFFRRERKRANRERGQGLVEYALLLVVVAALVIAFSSKATTAIATLTNTMSTCITTGVCNPFTSSGSGT